MARSPFRAGVSAIAPMLIGTVPFGLVAGASAVDQHLGIGAALGFSTIMCAGASQLAAIDVLGRGGGAVLAIVAAITINLRMVLYSASMAPHLVREKQWRRLVLAYLLTDHAYGVSIGRWDDGEPDERKFPFFVGAGVTLWVAWVGSTLVGALIGNRVPKDLPLDFAIPLVFLVLLIPALATKPAAVAAATGGTAAVLATHLGGANLSIITGALVGISGGVIAEIVIEGRTSPDDPDPTRRTGGSAHDPDSGLDPELGLDTGPAPT